MVEVSSHISTLALSFSAIPQWLILLFVVIAIVVGVFIGSIYWKQFRSHSVSIELETRRAQSEFDLVARDVTKTKQDAVALLASRNQKL